MKLLVIEDNEEIVEAVRVTLGVRWPDATLLTTGLGAEGVELAEREKPDIIILDIGLPDMNGYDVLKEIRSFSGVPLVVLTIRGEETDIVRGLELGADDYLVKPFRTLEFLSRIQTVLRRVNPVLSEGPLVCGGLYFKPLAKTVYYRKKEISLTNTESIILHELMRNAGHAVTYYRLAEIIWGNDYPNSLDALRVYIRRIREKIEDDPQNPQIITTKPGTGYLLVAPEIES